MQPLMALFLKEKERGIELLTISHFHPQQVNTRPCILFRVVPGIFTLYIPIKPSDGQPFKSRLIRLSAWVGIKKSCIDAKRVPYSKSSEVAFQRMA